MRSVLPRWLGFLALGAGLVHIALVIGSPIPVAAALLVVGLAEFAWGVFAVVRPELPLPSAARIGALVPVVAWGLLLVVAGTDSLGPLTSPGELAPMLVASLFDLLIAVGLTVVLRGGTSSSAPGGHPDAAPGRPDPARPPHPTRRLVATLVGALVVAALTAPALAATEAGRSAGSGGITVDTTGHDH